MSTGKVILIIFLVLVSLSIVGGIVTGVVWAVIVKSAVSSIPKAFTSLTPPKIT